MRDMHTFLKMIARVINVYNVIYLQTSNTNEGEDKKSDPSQIAVQRILSVA
jgi:hypothetical protein